MNSENNGISHQNESEYLNYDQIENRITTEKQIASRTWVWDMVDRTERGIIIEQHLGHNLPQTFPVIDKIVNNVVTNIIDEEGRAVRLKAPTRFMSEWINNHYGSIIARICQAEGYDFQEIEV